MVFCAREWCCIGAAVSGDDHGRHCFDRMLENEERLCGEFAVFYHSYSFAGASRLCSSLHASARAAARERADAEERVETRATVLARRTALLYEVQAAVAAVLFRFKSKYSSLPRLLVKPFLKVRGRLNHTVA